MKAILEIKENMKSEAIWYNFTPHMDNFSGFSRAFFQVWIENKKYKTVLYMSVLYIAQYNLIHFSGIIVKFLDLLHRIWYVMFSKNKPIF